MKIQAEINISKESSFLQTYYEGYVKFEENEYKFWLIWPRNTDNKGEEYEIEIQWFYQRIPKEVRRLTSTIIEQFKELHDL